MTEAPSSPEMQRGVEWSILGGHYSPEDPAYQLDAERLLAMWDSVRFYSGAMPRFWARETVAYAVELCGIDLAANPTVTEDVEHALNEDFAQATKLVLTSDSLKILPPGVDVAALEAAPVIAATRSILDATRRIKGVRVEGEIAQEAKDFSLVMVAIRLAKETKQAAAGT